MAFPYNFGTPINDLRTLGNALQANFRKAISGDSFTAKGDLLVGTGAGQFTNLAGGVNGSVLTADSTQPGLAAWRTPSKRAFEAQVVANITIPLASGDLINSAAVAGDGVMSLIIDVSGTVTNTVTGGYEFQIWDGAGGTGTKYADQYHYGVAASNQLIRVSTITIPPWTGNKTFYLRGNSQASTGILYGTASGVTSFMRGMWTPT